MRTNVNKLSTNEKWDTINKLTWSQSNLQLKEMNSDIVYVWHGTILGQFHNGRISVCVCMCVQ